MFILAQCPICRRRQSLKNDSCLCGENLVKAKASKRVRYCYSTAYRVADKKKRAWENFQT